MTEALRIERALPALAAVFDLDVSQLEAYAANLESNGTFASELAGAARATPEFASANLVRASDFRAFRSLLYVVTRACRPSVVVETGVLNGFGSAFILQALQDESKGALHSVDRPPTESHIIAQGTTPLPAGKAPGWAIPDALRARHELHLGAAEVVLPKLLAQLSSIDVFLHDSDHAYAHVMFEVGLAWHYLVPGGALLVDNVEQNSAFVDFARGVGAKHCIVSSFDSPGRKWQTGVLVRPR